MCDGLRLTLRLYYQQRAVNARSFIAHGEYVKAEIEAHKNCPDCLKAQSLPT